jgi:AAA ATPase domain
LEGFIVDSGRSSRRSSSGSAAENAFVGRDRELGLGLAVLDEVLRGRGRLLLITGEPGIGKSRLAEELATQAAERGAQVVWGRCWEAGGAPAYWPWVQSLRVLIRKTDAVELGARLGLGGGDIAQLLPEIQEVLGDIPAPRSLDPEAARFQLFDSVMTYLRATAAAHPLMVVLDDLQVADDPSLLLLRFAAAALGDDPMLILGTYRDTDLGPEQSLSPLLMNLAWEPAVRRLNLGGLAEADVSRFIEAATGFSPPESLARAVHQQTAGNPLFLQEVSRLFEDAGRLDPNWNEPGARVVIPATVREVIAQRLRPLSSESLNVLSLASILGREFSLDALTRLVGRVLGEVLESLEEPLAARVITDVPGTNNRLRFSHVVIRESLYDDIPSARRIKLHRRAGQCLEELYGADLEPHLAELAHHFFESSAGSHVKEAVEYSRRAGRRAMLLLAYEEAVRLYRMALRSLGSAKASDQVERCDLLLEFGDAQARAGDEVGRKESFLQAAELSKALGLSNHFARAALGYGGRLVWVRAGDDPGVIKLLEDGLAADGELEGALRAKMLARLAGALRDDPSREPRESLGRRAVELARQLDDPAVLAYTLEGLFAALWRPDNPHERLAIADKMVAIGEQTMDLERLIVGHQNRALAFLELGDIPSVHREHAAIEHVAAELRQAAHNWLPATTSAQLALLEGRFEDAESLISVARRLRGRTNRSDAIEGYAVQMFQLRREHGSLEEIEYPLARSARELTWYPILRCALAVVYVELDREALARTEFDTLATNDFAGVPFDNKWMFSMSLLSEVACYLRHPAAGTLYERLLPFAELCAVAGGDVCAGSVSRYLGLLAVAMARGDLALRHFDDALRDNERMGAHPSVAHTQHELAVTLAERGGEGDGKRATDLLTAAGTTCNELGMTALASRVTAALAGLGVSISGVHAPQEPLGPPDHTGETFQLEGEYWTVGYEGRVVRLRDSKGMRVLAELLTHPDRPHPSLDLERLGAPGDEATARAVASADAGELIDDVARRAYRARLTELRDTLEEADAWGKADEAGTLREEMDFITQELSRAVGLGGRSRRAGSTAERARLNVTRAVRSAMQRIAAVDDGLAAHLEATIHTGVVCVYTPDPRSRVAWRVSSRRTLAS